MKQQLQILQVIHLALCMGVSLFGAVTLLLAGKNANFNFDSASENMFTIVAVVVAAIASLVSGILANRIWQNINKNDDSMTKIGAYRSGAIIQWALLEGAALISIVGFLLHNNYFLLILGLAMLLVLFSKRPTTHQVNEITGIPEKEFQS